MCRMHIDGLRREDGIVAMALVGAWAGRESKPARGAVIVFWIGARYYL